MPWTCPPAPANMAGRRVCWGMAGGLTGAPAQSTLGVRYHPDPANACRRSCWLASGLDGNGSALPGGFCLETTLPEMVSLSW